MNAPGFFEDNKQLIGDFNPFAATGRRVELRELAARVVKVHPPFHRAAGAGSGFAGADKIRAALANGDDLHHRVHDEVGAGFELARTGLL